MENKEPHDIAEARIEIMNISKLGQNSRRALVDVAVNVDHNSNSGARGWRGQSTDDKIRVAYAKPKRGAKNQNEPVNNNDRPDETAVELRERERREREAVSSYFLLWKQNNYRKVSIPSSSLQKRILKASNFLLW